MIFLGGSCFLFFSFVIVFDFFFKYFVWRNVFIFFKPMFVIMSELLSSL